MMDFRQWARMIKQQIADVPVVSEMCLATIGKVAVFHAQEMIGHPQKGWAALAPSTQREKARLGFNPALGYEPLLRNGDLRDSFGAVVRPWMLTFGSSDRKMVWFEFGTHKMPPRPVVTPSMMVALEHGERIYGFAFQALLMGHRPGSPEMVAAILRGRSE